VERVFEWNVFEGEHVFEWNVHIGERVFVRTCLLGNAGILVERVYKETSIRGNVFIRERVY
jgi:hypothetical protein